MFHKIALGHRSKHDYQQHIKALTQKFSFGKYVGMTVEDVIETDPGYILWLSDEKVAKVDDVILSYADEADIDQRMSEAVDTEFRGMSYWDFLADDK